MSINVRQLDQGEWQAQTHRFHDHNYRQLWPFAAASAARFRATIENVAIEKDGMTIALASIRIKTLPIIGGGIAYINGGPLVRSADAIDGTLEQALKALRDEYAQERGLVLRVAPPPSHEESNARIADIYERLDFKPVEEARPYRTILVSLEPPLDVIRKKLDQKWRNCLNRAEKNGLSLRTASTADDFEVFCKLFDEMIARKQFDVDLDARFYAAVQSDLAADDQFSIALVEHEGNPIAGHVASYLGDTGVYLLGASNDAALTLKASYLLQWNAIETARARGCTTYDLGGIDPEGNPGVYHFKSGMGGAEVTARGPFEFAPGALKGKLVRAGEGLVRRYRRARRAASK